MRHSGAVSVHHPARIGPLLLGSYLNEPVLPPTGTFSAFKTLSL